MQNFLTNGLHSLKIRFWVKVANKFEFIPENSEERMLLSKGPQLKLGENELMKTQDNHHTKLLYTLPY